jgi:ribosomal protein L9
MGGPRFAFSAGQFFPNVDNATTLGSGSFRWSIVYAANGTINTSDGNEKQQIQDITASEKAVGLALKSKLKAFKFNNAVNEKGDGARIHFGIIAQDIKAAFEAEGLDPEKYGVFCKDTLEDGTIRLGVRYDELYALILSAI